MRSAADKMPAGTIFGRLRTLAVVGTSPAGKLVSCVCECGGRTVVAFARLQAGRVRSCGCGQREANLQHGKSYTVEYRAWHQMIARCERDRALEKKYYQARGITVAPVWRHDFAAFLAAVGSRPGQEYSLDRIDNDRGYEPGNVRWATRKEQQRNTRMAKPIRVGKLLLTREAWAERTGVSASAIRRRLKEGWKPEFAVSVPVGTYARGAVPKHMKFIKEV